jgi:hypothetical protein
MGEIGTKKKEKSVTRTVPADPWKVAPVIAPPIKEPVREPVTVPARRKSREA